MPWKPPVNFSPPTSGGGLFGFLSRGFRYLGGTLRYLVFSVKGALILAVVAILQNLLPKILLGLGVGIVTYNLGSYGLDAMYSNITSNFGGLPADFLTMMKLARIDEFLSVIFGAFTARLTLQGLSAGASIKKFGIFDA